MREVKEKVKDEVHSTENRGVTIARNAGGMIFNESQAAQATKIMRKYDPSFDLFDFHQEC